MTSIVAAAPAPSTPGEGLASQAINALLSVRPLWQVAKWQARSMMIRRAERLGIPWSATVAELRAVDWTPIWESVVDPALVYPANYRASFHGYDTGHLCWEAAFEFEVASRAVHSSLYPEAGADSDRALRDGYEEALLGALPQAPSTILELHGTVGWAASPCGGPSRRRW